MLVDPDKCGASHLDQLSEAPDLFLLGGSYVSNYRFAELSLELKSRFQRPVILFPADPTHLVKEADAVLFLSLVSGRNPEYLIGKHVIAAPFLKKSGLEVLPTAYMLIDSGQATSASYMSGTSGIPANKPDIAACTAMASEMLGLKYIYMDLGSGAEKSINLDMLRAVRAAVQLPIIIGGGIKDPEQLELLFKAGADTVVVGNTLEKEPSRIAEFMAVTREMTTSV